MRILIATVLLATGAFGQCAQEILVNAGDMAGVRVTGLTAQDLKARIGKLPLTITSVHDVHLTPRVILLFDISGSMQAEDPAPAIAMTMASAIFSLLEKDSPVAVGMFGDKLTTLTEFGLDRQASVEAIRTNLPKKQRWSGPTRIIEPVAEATGLFGEVQAGDTIVVISDGGDNRSWKVDEALRKIRKSGVRVFIAGPDLRNYEENEIQVAQGIYGSGGRWFLWGRSHSLGDRSYSDPLTPKEVQEILEEARNLVARIHHAYQLRFDSSTSQGSGDLKLELDTKRNKHFKSVGLEYPTALISCTRTAANE
jgi:hypothetical protein